MKKTNDKIERVMTERMLLHLVSLSPRVSMKSCLKKLAAESTRLYMKIQRNARCFCVIFVWIY